MQNDPELLTVTHGGIQTVPRADFTASPQIVYLDFDGAVTSYVNADLGVAIGGITVEPSGFGDDVTATIAAFLNGMFDDVVFTTELPSDGAFSTIYIGVASAFDEYGDFLGLAETIDSDNRIHDDNAFVLLDSSATAELVVSVIVHETEHIVHGMDHGGEGLARYADIIIKKGQVSSGLTIENDNLTVYSGGTAVGNTVNGGGTLNVDGGGTAVSTTVNEHGELWVFSGGTAVSTTVNYLGYLNVSSGGTAIGTTVNYFGDLNVSSGGTAVGTTLNSRQAHLWVSSGGTAIGTTVNSGGSLAVDRDGTAIGTTVNSGFLFLTGRAFDTTVNLGGQLWVHSGGTITGQTTFKGNAMVYVYSGGKITGRTTFEDWASFFVSGGAIFDFDISDISPFDNALVNNFYIVMGQPFSFTLTVSDWQAKGVYRLADGAGDFDKTVTVVDTLGAELGTLTVGGTLKKGKAEYTLAKSDDSLTVTVDVNTFTGDLDYEKNITDEILASGVNVNEGGILNLLSGGIAVSTTVNDGGNLNVRSGGTAVSTTVNYLGEMTVFDGGTAKETTVNSRGKIFVESGGSVENTTVNSSGWLYVSGGGSVDGTTVNQMGSAIVYADGVASGATVNYEGYLRVDQGGTAHDVVENGGGVFVNDDADATFKPNVFSGLEMTANYTTATVHSGTTANNTTLNGSGVKLEVYNGGTAIDTTVQNGWLEVRGGTAESVAVGSGGSLWLYPDARLTGQMTFEEGAVVIANGAVIDFDISAQSPDNAPLVNDLSLIKGTPSFTITVAESQAEGKYVLAGGTASFDKTLTVFTAEGETLGTITVGDTNVSIGEQVYSLVVSDGQLLFTVGELDTTPPNAPLATASTDKPTNQSVTVTATFSDDSVKKEYSLDNNTWKTYPSKGVKMADNGTVWFRGTDAAGNVSDVTSYKVANIDKVPPAAPTVSADITTPTNGFVTVTPVFSDDSIQRQVSLDGGVEWVGNIEQIVMTANGWVYFRGIDAAGNISETTGYEVTNIDILPPDAPVATASTTAPTNQSVTVTATFSDDSVKKQYSLNNKKWNTYKKGIVLTENCTVWFRSMDEAGNVSEVTSYEVTNIDKEPPAE
ncbi:MAG: AIDA repeat-containing protein, partial [Victivallales bacterium]|nr:AIDA repeat-containing protein [Victivallales bacterium]